ncbi:TetR/AcrR family transcriptional regulator [Luteolibacter sp. GHJ8]|jgi:AcrR family transcriptional regulator|uniref:TetR/AcrR family transcriptional regulator n=1 Tax=Luteolibacter rhizosphaerae TaxID=2989719 RepID=A0ABT3G862_9BACT|nr:TetR/AcrR family transcriptional regulator [Luteolibacter rhizosphaerae]MCW1916038.1 TetR/AcrR family transcriptional regulator [Luteolibacter rhizosphaerae]
MSDKTTTRGRPRSFDRSAALEAAMRVFWQKGFTAASMNDLCAAMEIGSPSLYAAFGSKEQLYAEAIRHYGAMGIPKLSHALESAPTAKLGIEAFLRLSARSLSCPEHPLGCMVVLSAVPSEGIASLADQVLEARQGSLQLLEARLQRGIREGELPKTTKVKALARFFVTVQQGMSIQARDGASAKELDAVASAAMRAWPAD